MGTGSVITGWLAAGYDLCADILPTLAERTVSVRISPIRTWDYFTAAIAERHARRVAHGGWSGICWGTRERVNRQRSPPSRALAHPRQRRCRGHGRGLDRRRPVRAPERRVRVDPRCADRPGARHRGPAPRPANLLIPEEDRP